MNTDILLVALFVTLGLLALIMIFWTVGYFAIKLSFKTLFGNKEDGET